MCYESGSHGGPVRRRAQGPRDCPVEGEEPGMFIQSSCPPLVEGLQRLPNPCFGNVCGVDLSGLARLRRKPWDRDMERLRGTRSKELVSTAAAYTSGPMWNIRRVCFSRFT